MPVWGLMEERSREERVDGRGGGRDDDGMVLKTL